MIVVGSALGFMLVMALTLLVGLLGAAAAKRWGGLLAALFAIAPAVLATYAGYEIGSVEAKLDDPDDIRRAFNWVMFLGLYGVTLVATCTSAFLLYRAVLSSRSNGLLRIGDLWRSLASVLTIASWTAAGMILLAGIGVTTIRAGGLDDQSEGVRRALGLATFGGGIGGFLLSVWGHLPGTRKQ